MSTAKTKESHGGLFDDLTESLPIIYEKGQPKAVVLDLQVFQALMEKLDELEERELLGDPKVVEGLRKAREDHLTGELTSHAELVKELGLEGEL